jgi:hypothetical protein
VLAVVAEADEDLDSRGVHGGAERGEGDHGDRVADVADALTACLQDARRDARRYRPAAMGRRARARGDAPPRNAGAPPPAAGGRERVGDRLGPARRILARYLGGATLIAILVLAGIAALGGTLGPFVVFAVAAVAAGLLHRWAQERLTGLQLSDEDRILQTLAGGLLLMAVFLALVAAVVLTVA